jgi:hypothetical protein
MGPEEPIKSEAGLHRPVVHFYPNQYRSQLGPRIYEGLRVSGSHVPKLDEGKTNIHLNPL